jgi:hypothetical protein
MNIDRIVVEDRHRSDLGDLTELTESIRAHGLMHPVVVTDDLRLIAGQRRLEACRALGWTDVKVTFASNVCDAAALLQMERDENVCRKDMTPSEKVALGKALTDMERPKASERQGTRTDLHRPPVPLNGKFGEVREVVAPAVGLSTASYSRAKQLVDAAEQGDAVAAGKVAEMDATGKISKPHAEWKASRGTKTAEAVKDRWEAVADLAAQGYSSRQIASKVDLNDETVRREARRRDIDIPADLVVGRTRRINSTDVVANIVAAYETANAAVSAINWSEVDPSEAQEWVSSLTESISAASAFRKKIKELTT